jgi:hypothetical protein
MNLISDSILKCIITYLKIEIHLLRWYCAVVPVSFFGSAMKQERNIWFVLDTKN